MTPQKSMSKSSRGSLFKSSRGSLFITGTDTGVGKTFVSALVVRALQELGVEVGYFKPVQTGLDSDTREVQRLGLLPEKRVARPVYFFPEPMAPSRAAELHGDSISLERIRDSWEGLPDRKWVVEGAGGILVPLNSRQTIRDLVACLNIPTLIVASTRLGTINHTLLTLEAAKHLDVRGVVLVGRPDPGLRETLQQFSSVSIIAEIPEYPEISPELVQKIAVELFPLPKLKEIFPDAIPR